MSGRTTVVTGASSGIGAATARELARAGARVVLAVRDTQKGELVAATIPDHTEVRSLDLADLASVRTFAAAWTGELHVLVNNAGTMMAPEGRTVDGFELHIGTNHLGPFALTNLLLPHITGRIVTVSSQLHRSGRIRMDDLNWNQRRFNASQAYGDSKLANLLFTLELQRRLTNNGSGVRAIAAHPGVARTNLFRHAGGLSGVLSNFILVFFNDVEHGSLPTLYAATQDVPGGSYVGPNGFGHLRGFPEIGTPSEAAMDAEVARDLWEVSARLTNTGSTPVADGPHQLPRPSG